MATLDELLIAAAYGQNSWKRSVDVVSTVAVDQSGARTIDGVAVTTDNTVLCVAQSNPALNGTWRIPSATGAWVRTDDAAVSAKMQLGSAVFVRRGSLGNAKSLWFLTSPTSGDINLGSTSLVYAKAFAVGSSPIITGYMKDTADGAAGDATSERAFFTARHAMTLRSFKIAPSGNLTAHDTDNATINIRRRGDGATVAVILTDTGSGDWTAFDDKDGGEVTPTALVAGDQLTIEISKDGAGVVVPICWFQIEGTVD